VNTRPWQIAAVFILLGQTNRSHSHQQAINAGGINTHQARQLPATNCPATGDQILQTTDTVDKTLIRL
jgi:hypothetical protein